VGTITSGSHVAFGAAYQWQAPDELPLDWEISGLYSIRNYQQYGARIGRLRTRRETFLLNPFGQRVTTEFNERRIKEPGLAAFADFNYFYFPRQNFFGLGPDSRREDRTDFLLEGTTIEAVAGYQFNSWFGASIRAGLLQLDVRDGKDDRYTNTSVLFPDVPGVEQQPDFYRISTAVLADYRDLPGDPHRGGQAGFLFSHHQDKDSSSFQFNRYALDVRHYLPLDPLLSVVALRFLTSVDDPLGNGEVPFYLAEALGGGSTLRGFSTLRFRDRNLLFLGGEFRTEVVDSVEIAVFYDTGKAFHDLDDYNLRGLQKGYGAGLRLKGGTTLFLRLDVGHSREGTHLHFNVGPAF